MAVVKTDLVVSLIECKHPSLLITIGQFLGAFTKTMQSYNKDVHGMVQKTEQQMRDFDANLNITEIIELEVTTIKFVIFLDVLMTYLL